MADTWWDRFDEETLLAAYTGAAGDTELDGVKLPACVFDTRAGARRQLREELHWRGLDSVLDLGCGPAQEWQGIVEDGLRVRYVGLDHRRRMLGAARRRFPEVPFVRSSLEALPFAAGSFAAAYTRHTLEHLPHYPKAVGEMCRVARDVVIVSLFRWTLYRPEERVLDDGRWENRVNLNTLGGEFERHGFRYHEAFRYSFSWDTVLIFTRARPPEETVAAAG